MSSIFDTAETTDSTDSQEEQSQSQNVNWDEEVTVTKPDADFNITPPPPPAGKYPAKLSLAEKGVEGKFSPKVGNFLTVYLQANIIANGLDFDNYTVLDYPNTIVDSRKGTSAIHSLMDKLGEPIPSGMKLKDMKVHIERVLNSNPVGNIELEWQAKEKDPGNRRADKNGYVTLATRMNQFPTKNGIRSNFIPSEKDKSPIPASAFILAYHR